MKPDGVDWEWLGEDDSLWTATLWKDGKPLGGIICDKSVYQVIWLRREAEERLRNVCKESVDG